MTGGWIESWNVSSGRLVRYDGHGNGVGFIARRKREAQRTWSAKGKQKTQEKRGIGTGKKHLIAGREEMEGEGQTGTGTKTGDKNRRNGWNFYWRVA